MIIDIHVHLVGLNEDNGCHVSPKLSRGIVYHLLSHVLGLRGVPREEMDEAFRKRMIEWVHESDVDAVGILALDGVYDEEGVLDLDRTHVYVPNEYLFEVCDTSEQLLPIASINPQRHDALEELDRVVEGGAVAIKMLPNSQGFDPGDEAYVPFWEKMAEHSIPALSHTSFEHTIPPIKQAYGKPERLRNALEAGVDVIAAHCASAGLVHIREDIGTWQEMIREYPNLYGDISAMASLARFPYLKTVLNDDVALQRIILGSDFPIPVSPMLFARKMGFARARELSKLDNPIQKNFEVFREAGVPDAVMRRGAEVLKL